MQVRVSTRQVERHAAAIWEIMGPGGFELFPDVLDTLTALRERALPLAMISNWQCGLRHFCEELGLSGFFDYILGSADLGVAKPDPRIFHDACRRLGVMPAHVLHVGDSFVDDYAGGESAGMNVALLARGGDADPLALNVIDGLAELPDLVAGPRP
jgi:putative hydrolase of the HAD superfamily